MVGGGGWRLAVSGGWHLAVGGWWLAVGGAWTVTLHPLTVILCRLSLSFGYCGRPQTVLRTNQKATWMVQGVGGVGSFRSFRGLALREQSTYRLRSSAGISIHSTTNSAIFFPRPRRGRKRPHGAPGLALVTPLPTSIEIRPKEAKPPVKRDVRWHPTYSYFLVRIGVPKPEPKGRRVATGPKWHTSSNTKRGETSALGHGREQGYQGAAARPEALRASRCAVIWQCEGTCTSAHKGVVLHSAGTALNNEFAFQ